MKKSKDQYSDPLNVMSEVTRASSCVLPFLVAASALVLIACSSGPTPKVDKTNAPSSKFLPEWVGNPTIMDGIASTGCVLWGEDISLDRAEAVAEARSDLAKTIEIKVKAMDKTYASTNRTPDGSTWGGSFETVSKQVTDQYLSASQVVNVDKVEIDKKEHLCAMVVLEGAASRQLFDEIVGRSAAEKPVNTQDEDMLWEAFKASQGHDELTSETR